MQAFFVRLARNRETVDMKERIDLVSPKILHCSGSELDFARNYPIRNLSGH